MTETFTVTALQNETLDALIWRTLRQGPSVLQTVLDLNRDLADLGQTLPEGHVVILPRQTGPKIETQTLIQLWD